MALSKVTLLMSLLKVESKHLQPLKRSFRRNFPNFKLIGGKYTPYLFAVTIETKIREFQYKMLNNIAFTNEKLFRLKMIDSPLRTFCKREIESIQHLFFYCDVTMIFWEALCSWLSNYKIGVQPFTLIDILFGVFNIGDDFSIINHLILTAKLYIYKCKLDNIHPNLRVYKANIKSVYLVEKKIARRRNKLIKHFKKWEKLLAYVDS